jgi:hypothetical protein
VFNGDYQVTVTLNRQARFAPGIVEGPLLKKPIRFNALPIQVVGTFVIGTTIVPQNAKRVGLIIANLGTGNLYISTDQRISSTDWIIPPGSSLTWPGTDGPTAPLNAIYGIADAGHDIRILETVLAPLLGTEFIA